MNRIELNLHIPDSISAERLDRILSQLLSDYSRAQIQDWIKKSYVKVNQQVINKTRHPVYAGDVIDINATMPTITETNAQPIELDICYADDDLIVINKPQGLIVHPGAGHPSGTLVNALLHFDPTLESLPRAGLIHRLDKDTSGLLIVARHSKAYHALIEAMQQREIQRHYLALVQGLIISGGSIDEPIGRHPTARTKMAIHPKGKAAITHYRIKEKYRAHTLLDIKLETGRTHQIRVHLTHKGYPLIGDPVYKKQKALESKISPPLQQAIVEFKRQALHAHTLSFAHPISQETLFFQAPLPDDFQSLITAMQTDFQQSIE